jgi:hypothetical protein
MVTAPPTERECVDLVDQFIAGRLDRNAFCEQIHELEARLPEDDPDTEIDFRDMVRRCISDLAFYAACTPEDLDDEVRRWKLRLDRGAEWWVSEVDAGRWPYMEDWTLDELFGSLVEMLTSEDAGEPARLLEERDYHAALRALEIAYADVEPLPNTNDAELFRRIRARLGVD